MDKDTVLKLSRKENEKRTGEWELSIMNKASGIARWAGLTACMILVLADEFLFHTRVVGIGAWIVYFAIDGSTDLVLYVHCHRKSKLIWAVVKLLCAVLDLIILFVYCLR